MFFIQSRKELIRIQKALKNEKYLQYFEWDREMEHYDAPGSSDEEEHLTKSRKLAYIFKYYNISKETWENSKNSSSIELGKISYGIFFNKFHFVIGHYFRHMYHIFNYLEEKEIEKTKEADKNDINAINKEFETYANFVQAQMTTPELFLLFYNSLSFPKLQKLLIKYNVLENLTIEDLVKEKDNCINGINLKKRKDLIE